MKTCSNCGCPESAGSLNHCPVTSGHSYTLGKVEFTDPYERLHKADGMAHEINILTREVKRLERQLAAERAARERAEAALRNVQLFAQRLFHKTNSGDWETVLRFCSSVGVEGGIAREALAGQEEELDATTE